MLRGHESPATIARRSEILVAAMQVFATKGFNAATMNDIVAATGISKGGLYWHFKSKDAIITGLLEHFFNPELIWMQELVAQEQRSAVERLRELSAQLADSLLSMQELNSVVLEFFALAVRDAAVGQFINSYYRRYAAGLAGLLTQGVAKGEWQITAVESVALTIVAQFEGIALLWSLDPAQFNLREHCMQACALLERALQAQT